MHTVVRACRTPFNHNGTGLTYHARLSGPTAQPLATVTKPFQSSVVVRAPDAGWTFTSTPSPHQRSPHRTPRHARPGNARLSLHARHTRTSVISSSLDGKTVIWASVPGLPGDALLLSSKAGFVQAWTFELCLPALASLNDVFCISVGDFLVLISARRGCQLGLPG